MRQSSLELIAPLLDVLRANPALHEIRPTEFLLDGKAFLHFHDDADGVVADVLLTRGRVSMPVSLTFDQAELLERIDQNLSSLESRASDRQRRRRR